MAEGEGGRSETPGEAYHILTMCADLTGAGYGPDPAGTLTWRAFWFLWHHHYLRRDRARREAENWQIWLATLQRNPEKAQEHMLSLEAGQRTVDAFVTGRLYRLLPPSVQALVSRPDPAAAITQDGDALGWWDKVIASAPPGSGQERFYTAGRDAARRRREIN